MSKLRFNSGQKVAMVLACLWAIWYMVPWERFGYALLEFALAGVVPGTNVVLSPNQVILGVMVAMGLSILLLSLLNLLRFLAGSSDDEFTPPISQIGKSAPRPNRIAATVKAKPDLRFKLPAVNFKKPDLVGQRSRQFVMLIYGLWWRYVEFAKRLSGRLTTQLLKFSRRTRQVLVPLLHSLRMLAFTLEAFVWDKIVVLGQAGWRTIRAVWQWLSPYLWQLDTWLGDQFTKLNHWSNQHLHHHDISHLFAAIAREYKATLTRMDLPTIHQYLKKQFEKLKNFFL